MRSNKKAGKEKKNPAVTETDTELNRIVFDTNSFDDRIFSKLKDIPDFSSYVKNLITEDLEKKTELAEKEELLNDFKTWAKENYHYYYSEYVCGLALSGLSSIGIKIDSLSEINDYHMVRLYISTMVLNKDLCKKSVQNKFMHVIDLLLCYSDYLEERSHFKGRVPQYLSADDTTVSKTSEATSASKKIPSRKREKNESVLVAANNIANRTTEKIESAERTVSTDEQPVADEMVEVRKTGESTLLDDSLTVAYYLSRFDKRAVSNLGYNSTTAAFKEIGRILNKKSTSIKNMRDEFDPYFDNPRAGWYQRPLRGSRVLVFDRYKNVSEDELDRIVKNILAEYTEKNIKNSIAAKLGGNKHTKLKIGSNNMKHIRKK